MTPKSGMLLTEEEIDTIWMQACSVDRKSVPQMLWFARRIEAAVLRKWGRDLSGAKADPDSGVSTLAIHTIGACHNIGGKMLKAAAEAEKEAEG